MVGMWRIARVGRNDSQVILAGVSLVLLLGSLGLLRRSFLGLLLRFFLGPLEQAEGIAGKLVSWRLGVRLGGSIGSCRRIGGVAARQGPGVVVGCNAQGLLHAVHVLGAAL